MKLINYSKGLVCDGWIYIKSTFGRALRETGLRFDVYGANIQNDIAHLDPLNRHKNLLPLPGRTLRVSPSAHIAPNATVFGSVFIGQNSYFGFGSVANGNFHPIRVGSNTKIGENTVLQTNCIASEEAYPPSVNIGNNVNIQNNCNLMSCIVDDDVHIGFKSVIAEGCQLQRGCVIAPNSYIPAGSRIPAYTLWAGSPARFVRNLSQEEQNKVEQDSKEQIRICQL